MFLALGQSNQVSGLLFRLLFVKTMVHYTKRNRNLHDVLVLRTFARKFSDIDFFLKISPLKDDELVMPEMQNKWGVTDFVLERTCPEEHLNLSKSGFVSEEGHGGCKSQNIAIRALKGKFSAKYDLTGPIINEFSQLMRFVKEQVRI